MRTIFKFLLPFCFAFQIVAGGWVYGYQPPAEIFLNSKVSLKNREVRRIQAFLFTRVDLNLNKTASSTLSKSKASLYAQHNFAQYLHGQVQWDDDFSDTEKTMLQALYRQVNSVSAKVNGLTCIHTFSRDNIQSYIYAVEAPKDKRKTITQREAIHKIQKAADIGNPALDDITYFEMALRQPELVDPKIGVKKLNLSCGKNFVHFLLGMDLHDAGQFANDFQVTLPHVAKLDKFQLAVLLDERPYDATLSLAFASKLLEDSHTEFAKLVLKNSCRLEKFSTIYDEISIKNKAYRLEPSGAYRHPVDSFNCQQLHIEAANSQFVLNAFSEAVLNSLGDLPLGKSNVQHFFLSGDYSQLSDVELNDVFAELQKSLESDVSSELFDAIGNVLIAGDCPLMAYCFWHQALYMDPENEHLKNKIIAHAEGLDLIKFSKLL